MHELSLLDFKVYNLFYYFVIYAFMGWCIETVYVSIKTRNFVNRGFLNGPFCPIYGFGAVILIVCLNPVKENPFLLFSGSVISTSFLEYFTGYVLEKVFHSTWWDYSNRRFNIHGRICLRFSIAWGILSLFFLSFIHPKVYIIMSFIPIKYGIVILYILIFYFITDMAIVVNSIIGLNSRLSILHALYTEHLKTKIEYLKDATEDRKDVIEKRMHDLRAKYEALIDKKISGHSRLLHAFPSLKSKNFNSILNELKERLTK